MSLRQGPERMGNISGYLGSTLSSTTSIMDRLVDKGLVQRAPDPNDRRVVTIGLTPLGADSMEQFWRIGRMKIEALAEPLNAGELETVVTAMELLLRASENL